MPRIFSLTFFAVAALSLPAGMALAQQAVAPAQTFQNVPPPTLGASPPTAGASAPAATGGDGPLTSSAGCEADLNGLQGKYQAQVAILNKMVSKTKKLDPIASCPKLKALVSIDAQVVAYLKKNQAWCGIPDDMMGQIGERRTKDASYAAQACNIAEQMRKAQSQQAAGVAPLQATRLPAGPL